MSGRLLMLLAVPVTAWAAPEGWPDLPAREACEAVLTVQKANCDVEHVFRCPGGVQLSESEDAGTGERTTAYYRDALTPWTLASEGDGYFFLFSDISPAARIEDVAAGRWVAQRGTARMWTPIFVQPLIGTLQSSPSGSMAEEVVDSVPLMRLRGDLAVTFNGGLLRFGGWADEYVDLARGVTFSGSSFLTFFGNPVDGVEEASPVRLILPGQPGFLAPPDPDKCLQLGAAAPLSAGGRA